MKRLSLLLLVLFSVSALAQSSHSVTLAWQPSADAAGNPTLNYNVYRGTGACPASGVPLASSKISSATTTTFTDTAVSVGQTYCYFITAALNGSESADSNTAGGTIPIAPPGSLTVTVK